MPDRFHKIYRIPSSRLVQWDYSSNGYYFVTICTREKEHYFGEIVDGVMKLSLTGQIAKKYWLEIPEHFPVVELDEYVIMPNHIHGIVTIHVETLHCNVSTTNNDKNVKNNFYSEISPNPKSLPAIIRSYKSICTKTINRMENQSFFAWQSRFYDHIIRNDASLNRIREYIQNNPAQWDEDIENIKNDGRDAINRVSTVTDYYKNII